MFKTSTWPIVLYLFPLKSLARLAHMLAYCKHSKIGLGLHGLLQSPPLPIALHHSASLISRTCLAPEAFEFVTPINAVSAALTWNNSLKSRTAFFREVTTRSKILTYQQLPDPVGLRQPFTDSDIFLIFCIYLYPTSFQKRIRDSL